MIEGIEEVDRRDEARTKVIRSTESNHWRRSFCNILYSLTLNGLNSAGFPGVISSFCVCDPWNTKQQCKQNKRFYAYQTVPVLSAVASLCSTVSATLYHYHYSYSCSYISLIFVFSSLWPVVVSWSRWLVGRLANWLMGFDKLFDWLIVCLLDCVQNLRGGRQ